MVDFNLSSEERKILFQKLIKRLEYYYNNTSQYKVSPLLDKTKVSQIVRSITLNEGGDYETKLDTLIDALEEHAVHISHPMYFGLFNPRSNFAGILADLITAFFNPQMATWSHSPMAVEIESHLIEELCLKFGYQKESADGVFTSGGAEANLTALICAINKKFPEFANKGWIGQKKRPIIYCSAEAHHSVVKAARNVGLGDQSVTNVEVNDQQAIKPDYLAAQIQKDLAAGAYPFMLVATLGTTGAGGIDDFEAISKIAKANQLWMHVDAAYGGACVLHAGLKKFAKGIEKSDSITFDAHKWLSVPMGSGIFLTSHKDILHQSFRITTEYMPKEGRGVDIVDPYTHSIQWSRRFIGLKLYLSLLFFGWEGYQDLIAEQLAVANYFRAQLEVNGWTVKNNTPLPIVCFTDANFEKDQSFASFISQHVIATGKSWISIYPINGLSTIRVCITNFESSNEEINQLMTLLSEARKAYG